MFGTAGAEIVAIIGTGIDAMYRIAPELVATGDVKEYGGIQENHRILFAVVRKRAKVRERQGRRDN